jgi:hypothetical protein
MADDPRVAALAPDLRWDFPLRLLGGLHWLVLGGEANWSDVDGALERHAAALRRFTSEQRVQTNEVQRAWALLPGLLALDRGPLDLVEIGASAGLLLVLDHYRYGYRYGAWGPAEAELVLAGDDRRPVPAGLLTRPLTVRRRRGIDLSPVRLDDEGARLLEAFVWADQLARIERLRRAIAIARRHDVRIERGDYVDLVPDVLAQRHDDALTVVLSSVTTTYLPDQRYAELVRALERAGRQGPLAWLSLEGPRGDESFGGLALELTTWPGGATRRLARVDFHAEWLEWHG